MSRNDTLILDGHTLTLETLEKVAREHRPVTLSSDGLARMAAARKLVDTAITEKKPVYGVTTGLGARVVEALDAETLADFSYKTVRGRAHAVGKPVPRETVRAAMTVRANTLLKGAAAASPAIAEHLVACLNAGITPVVGEIASIGAGDLVWNATMSLALIGEGPMEDAGGNVGPGSGIMKTAGITPLELGPRDGLALCNNASHSAALSGLSIASAKTMYEAVQSAAALSLEGFLANLSPFDGRVLALRPQPGQHNAATGIMDRLQESKLLAADTARRLQDPLSIRNIPQIHGAVDAALVFAGEAVT
ncbi:MAG: aromatic amino acid lyase, partial [Hyphomicrobiaceae bacterium]